LNPIIFISCYNGGKKLKQILRLIIVFIILILICPVSSANVNIKLKVDPYESQTSQTELKIKIDVFCVSIKNIGNKVATNIVVDIDLTGELLLVGQKSSRGIITSLRAGETHEECANPELMLGYGEVTLTTTVSAENAPDIQESKVIGRMIGTIFTPYRDVAIDVSTDKEEYGINEPITVIVTNIGETKIEIGGPCFYIYNDIEELVWEGCMYCYWELEPGEFETWIWNQKNMNEEQVPGGTYTIKGEFRIDDELYTDTDVFYIYTTAKFYGYVYASDRQTPLENATISIDAVDCIWITDKNGYYETGYHWTPRCWDLIAYPPHEYLDIYMCSFQIAQVDKGETCWVNFTLDDKKKNTPPNNLEIQGPTNCRIGKKNEYLLSAVDSESDQIYFSVYWGDGSFADFYKANSNGEIKVEKTWYEKGEYTIQVYAVDQYAYYSHLVKLDITVTKAKQISYPLTRRVLVDKITLIAKLKIFNPIF